MAWKQHLDFAPIPFVREKDGDTGTHCSPKDDQQSSLEDGNTAKSFYETLVGLKDSENNESCFTSSKSSSVKKKECSKRKRKVSHETSCITKNKYPNVGKGEKHVDLGKTVICRLMKAAQMGDVDAMKREISRGVDINMADQYGWTALMCAVQSGHSSTVKLLLSRGADPTIKDKSKMTAIDIAYKSKRPHLVDLMEKWHKHSESHDCEKELDEAEPPSGNVTESHFCSTCNSEFSSTEVAHVASTVHLFNLKLKPKPTSYLIPQHNPGYRMMLRSGWNQEKGLGPEGQGQKFPVKTILKRDREGLGSKTQQRARITHFNPKDVQAVRHVKHKRTERAATLSKKSLKARAKRDREKERRFRREFYS